MSLPHLGLILMINLLWGFNFVATKWALADLPPIWTACLRFVLVAVICIPWLKFRVSTIRPIVIVATLAAFHFSLGNAALAEAKSAGTMAVTAQLGVPISTMLAVFFLQERIGWKRISGILLAFMGVIVLKWDSSGEGENTLALALMFLSCVVYGFAAINMRRLRGVTPLELQAWTGVVSVVILSVLAFSIEGNPWPAIEKTGTLAWTGVAYSAIGSSVLAHAANFFLLQRYPVTTVAPFTLLTPLIGVISGIIVLGDAITSGLILGGILTMAGVGVITLRSVRKAKEKGA